MHRSANSLLCVVSPLPHWSSLSCGRLLYNGSFHFRRAGKGLFWNLRKIDVGKCNLYLNVASPVAQWDNDQEGDEGQAACDDWYSLGHNQVSHTLFCWYSIQQGTKGTASPSSLAQKWNTSATYQQNWNPTNRSKDYILDISTWTNWRVNSSRPMLDDSFQRLCKIGDDAVLLVKVTNNIILIIISIVIKINTNFGCRQFIYTIYQSSTYISLGRVTWVVTTDSMTLDEYWTHCK